MVGSFPPAKPPGKNAASSKPGIGEPRNSSTLSKAVSSTRFVTRLYRVVDHENQQNIDVLPHLVFLNVVGLGNAGRARGELDAFEHNRTGAQVDAKGWRHMTDIGAIRVPVFSGALVGGRTSCS